MKIKFIIYIFLCCLLLNSCSKKKEKNNVESPKLRVEHKDTKVTLPQIKPKNSSQKKTKKYSNTNLSVKINEINDLLLNDSELPFSSENKLKNLLKKMNLEFLSKNERLKEGINNITEAANKVFDLSRPLSKKDIEDLKKLDPRQLDQLIADALETGQNGRRNLILCEIGLRKSNPLDVRGFVSLSAKNIKINLFEPYNDLIDYQKNLLDECNNTRNLNNEGINMFVNVSKYLSSYYWNIGDYESAAEMAEKTLDFINELPPSLIIKYRGGNLLSATRKFARAGHLDKALKLIEESKNIEMSKRSKRRLLGEEYKKELNYYYNKYQSSKKDKKKFR